jgi:hypothetical protein
MKRTGYFYSVEDNNDDHFEDAYELWAYDWNIRRYDLDDDLDIQHLAEACADDFVSNHDGWECSSWLNGNHEKLFYIWKDSTTKIAVRIYAEPTVHFNARID